MSRTRGCARLGGQGRSYCNACLDWLGSVTPGDPQALNVALALVDQSCIREELPDIDVEALGLRLGLPRSAVRDALRRLAAAGLLPLEAVA